LEKLDKPRTRKKHKEMPTQEEVVKFFEHLSKAPLKKSINVHMAFAGGLRRESIEDETASVMQNVHNRSFYK
jgi:hypothetical protein